MDQLIENFVQGKRLAVVGLSRSGKKFGNIAYQELKARGYELYVVHPEAKEIDGVSCYPDLASLAGMVDGAFLCLPPKKGKAVLADAAAAGITKVWLQQGSESTEVLAEAKKLNLQVVSGKCILMYAPPVRSFHGFHRFVMKVIGQL
jgi:hypothetical protein